MPPMPPPDGIGGSSLGISVITASAVVSKDATPDASVMAVRTTYIKENPFSSVSCSWEFFTVAYNLNVSRS